MNKESRLLVDLWDVVGEAFPKSQRLDAAISIIRVLEEYGIDARDFEDATEEDNYILHAFEAVVERDEDYEEDEGYEN